jgi:hypothetical protein
MYLTCDGVHGMWWNVEEEVAPWAGGVWPGLPLLHLRDQSDGAAGGHIDLS